MNTEENDIEAENDLRDSRLTRILAHYGKEHQRWKLVEECGELLAELGRFKNGDRTNVADLVHEMADVIVVARQLFDTGAECSPDVDTVLFLKRAVVGLADFVTIPASPRLAEDRAKDMEFYAFELARILGSETMLVEAIEMKTARQIERIEQEGKE